MSSEQANAPRALRRSDREDPSITEILLDSDRAAHRYTTPSLSVQSDSPAVLIHTKHDDQPTNVQVESLCQY